MAEKGYNWRIIRPRRADDLAKELMQCGVEPARVLELAELAGPYTIRIRNLRLQVAEQLIAALRSCGGDAAITDRSDSVTDIVAVGSFQCMGKALVLFAQSGLDESPDLAAAISASINACEVGPFLPGNPKLLPAKARWMFEQMAGRTLVMGILNVTPDSFSDGGQFIDPGTALSRAIKMVEEGADIIDIGGESTRPGSEPLSTEEEITRVVPIIRELSSRIDIPISIDTYHAKTAEAALDAGADIINDISGMAFDPDMKHLAAERRCPVVLMHIKGTPKDMQKNPVYEDVMLEVATYLRERVADAVGAGVDENLIIIDPGIGFGKTASDNLCIINKLDELRALGRPILMGLSRKATIGQVLGGLPPQERVEGTGAADAISVVNGANIVRVHDVEHNVRVVKVADAIIRS